MPTRVRVRTGVITLAVLLVAGCSSTVVDGRPHARPRSVVPSSSGRPSTSSSPSPSPSSAAPTGGSGSDAARLADPARVRTILADTRQDLVASQSYDYRTLAADRSRALARTTGMFHSDLQTTLTRTVDPLATRLRANQRVAVSVIAIRSADPTRATLLAALTQHITEAGKAPRIDATVAQVSVSEIRGQWLISHLIPRAGGGPAQGIGSSGLDAALAAAQRGVTDLTSYRRASFASDYARAVAATTGSLRSDVVRRRAATLDELRRGGFDLVGTVTGTGAVSVAPAAVVVLVTASTARSDRPAVPVPATLEATVVRVGGRWLLSALQSVGLT